jgi:RND family efflux transporter MFP subunit
MTRQTWLLLPLLLSAALLGCDQGQHPQPPPPGPAEVLVSLPITREVTDYEEFPGQTEAIPTVEIRARVTGYLAKVYFKDGADVQKDDLLFEIDPRPYQAALDRAQANLVQSDVHMKRLEADYKRALNLYPKGAMGREEYDKITGDRGEACAACGVAQANLNLAKLNLEFCKVRAPFSGRISRRTIDPGNMVKADETALTYLVSLNPIYVYFDVDERTFLRLQRLILQGHIQSARDGDVPCEMALADEAEGVFPYKGVINFVDNRVDAGTGTLRLRGVFENPQGIIAPGLFVRVRSPVGKPQQAILVAEQALATDQGQKFVYVVNDKDQAVYQPVKIGRLHHGLRAITEGLKPGQRVIVSGLQRVRPGAQVAPKVVEMPIRSSQGSGDRSQASAAGKANGH